MLLNERKRRYCLLFALPSAVVVLVVSITAMPASKADAAIRDGQPIQACGAKAPNEYDNDPSALLVAYRHVEGASVSDAIEQLLGRKMYLSHRMQPLFRTRFTGYALTVRMEKRENHDAHAVDGMLEAIDQGKKDSVYVMSGPIPLSVPKTSSLGAKDALYHQM